MSSALACSATLESNSHSTESRAHILRRNLRRSVLDGGYYGWMVGVGESYIPAFALAVGMGEVTTGLIVSVPMLFGGIAQLISLKAIGWFGSYRNWIVFASSIQAMAFIPLMVAAWLGQISPWLLFLVVSLYWGSGMAAGPAWNAWISNVVPMRIRSRYFAKRTRLIQLATFGGFLFGGGLIYLANRFDSVLVGFGTLFLIAAIARLISAGYLITHQVLDGSDTPVRFERNPDGEAVQSVSMIGRRLILYLVCMQVFVQFSGPYFVPYMLKKLQMGYEQFVVLCGMAFICKAMAMPLWGALASRRGGRFLLGIGGIGVIPLSSLWTVSDHFAWIMLVQGASGAVWAAYELGFFLVFLNDVPQSQRAKLMTIYNFANSIAWFSGSLLGGWLLAYGQASYHAYHWIFWVSSIGRLSALVLLWRVQHCPKEIPPKRLRKQFGITNRTDEEGKLAPFASPSSNYTNAPNSVPISASEQAA